MRRMKEVFRDRTPIVLPPTATVADACREMRDRRIGAVIVADADRRLLGIFTGRDAVWRMLAEGRDPYATALADVMTPKPLTISPGRTAIDALRMMEDGGFRHVPVVAEGKIVGVVSRADFQGLEQAQLEEEISFWERI
jgi:CBS domain-containing protein